MSWWKTLIKPCLAIVVLATILGVGLNVALPHGLPFLPVEISNPLWQKIDSRQFYDLSTQGAIILDARPAGDYNKARIKGAIKFPVGDIDTLYPLLKDNLVKAPAIIIYGKSFSSFPAATVGQYLRNQKIEKVYATEAGLFDLVKAGFAIQEPKRKAQ